MIKKLLFTAASLAPCLAYCANPSADLSVQIVPAGSTLAVPAAAQAVGLTTLVLHSDFSQPRYRHTANWLDCIGSNTDAEWHQGYTFVDSPPGLPCNIPQVTDPLDGSTVIDVYWDPSYNVGNGAWAHQVINITAHDNSHGISLPNAFYVETVSRIAGTLSNTLQADWSGPLHCCDRTNGWFEMDMIEQATFTNGANTAYYTINQWVTGHDNCGDGRWCDQAHVTYPDTAYVRRGMLLTFDGTFLGQCNYENDAETPNPGCKQTIYNASSVEANQRNIFLIANGPVDPTTTLSGVSHRYVKSVKIWSCANWRTRQCITALRGSGQ
jgi:hypothetical protein